jgi:hypothetical protein
MSENIVATIDNSEGGALPKGYESFSQLEVLKKDDASERFRGVLVLGQGEDRSERRLNLGELDLAAAFGHAPTDSAETKEYQENPDKWRRDKQKIYVESRSLPYFGTEASRPPVSEPEETEAAITEISEIKSQMAELVETVNALAVQMGALVTTLAEQQKLERERLDIERQRIEDRQRELDARSQALDQRENELDDDWEAGPSAQSRGVFKTRPAPDSHYRWYTPWRPRRYQVVETLSDGSDVERYRYEEDSSGMIVAVGALVISAVALAVALSKNNHDKEVKVLRNEVHHTQDRLDVHIQKDVSRDSVDTARDNANAKRDDAQDAKIAKLEKLKAQVRKLVADEARERAQERTAGIEQQQATGASLYVEPGGSITQEIQQYAQARGYSNISDNQAWSIYQQLRNEYGTELIESPAYGDDTYIRPQGDVGISHSGPAYWPKQVKSELDELLRQR